MDKDTDTKKTSEKPVTFKWNDLDEETIAILVDDKIATGG